jgi:sugar-specific transcriptional regulator TrmB
MDLANQLKQAGLNISEIKIYIYLLENGLSTPPKVSQGTFVARTNCYNVLQSLKEKGLIEEQLIRSRKAYLASDPESIVRSLQKKKEVIE